jgi:hypothetical protein
LAASDSGTLLPMQTVHEASNLLEAQVLKDVLRQQGITAHVLGEYLQGGIGELPAQGLVRLSVDDPDAERARQLLREWEREQPPEAAPPPPAGAGRASRWPSFLAGLLCGALLTAWWMG